MAHMGMEALYRKPGTSKQHPEHELSPSLLRGLTINQANQVGALDLTDIPMANGFVSLTAVVDWASRTVLAEKTAGTLKTCQAVDVRQEAHAPRHAGDCEHRPRPSVQRARVRARRQRTGMHTQHGRTRSLEGIRCLWSACGNR